MPGASLLEKVEALAQKFTGPLVEEELFEVTQQRLSPPDQVPVSIEWMEDQGLKAELSADDLQGLE
eukprot:11223809-Lingulodinium_polyedra.AAC.1